MFFDSINFEGTVLTYTGTSDVFFVKYNTSGALIWAKRISGSSSSPLNSIETDTANNIYFVGSTNSSITFFGSPNIILNTSGLKDGFIAKYDPNGNVLLAKLISSASDNDIGNIKIANSIIFVSGTYAGSVNLGNAVILNSSTGSNDIFLSKFDLNGNCLSAVNLGSSTTEIKKLAVDASSNVYICGTIYGPTSIGGIILSNNINYLSAFFAKANSSLDIAFANTLPSNISSSANSIQVDGSGKIYILGNYNGSVSNGPQTILSNGGADIFLSKYSPIGGAISILSYGGSGFDTANNFLVGPSNFIAGSFNGSINLGTVLTTSTTTIGSLNGFIVRISE